MNIKSIAVALFGLVVACMGCKQEEYPEGPLRYMSFTDRQPTIEVSPTTTEGRIALTVDVDVPRMGQGARDVPLRVFEQESTAKQGIHYALKENNAFVWTPEDGFTSFRFEIFPQNITEPVTLVVYDPAMAGYPNPDRRFVFDVTEVTLKPKS